MLFERRKETFSTRNKQRVCIFFYYFRFRTQYIQCISMYILYIDFLPFLFRSTIRNLHFLDTYSEHFLAHPRREKKRKKVHFIGYTYCTISLNVNAMLKGREYNHLKNRG